MRYVADAVKDTWKQSGDVNTFAMASPLSLSRTFLLGCVENVANGITTPTSIRRCGRSLPTVISSPEHVSIPVARYQEGEAA